ncbi:hypothetical protein AJ80_05119 [Polytolypa hystricis UAMH7299]|uniref:RING-type domain-containing protein n=1 Tax=Polytolypa hystricis (strain UAMH7299) TaxID=1447883 RepID=A0A2B7Y7N0_POLH7|nr:hypothetical protein AJ80_05119 [Polytolypa hystricis UAMH7299]
MGQASSTQRDSLHNSSSPSSSQLPPGRSGGRLSINANTSLEHYSRRHSNMDNNNPTNHLPNTDLASSSANNPIPRTASTVDMENVSSTERGASPMVSVEDLGQRNASTTQISAASASSRQSTMSRLGSRILPNAVVRGLLNSGEETLAEGRAHRTGLLSRASARSFPSLGNISSRGITRRRSIRGPYPLPRGDAALLPDSPPNLDAASVQRASESPRLSWRYRARLSHVRHSISNPISQIFGQPPRSELNHTSATPPPRPSRPGLLDDADHLLPPLASVDSRMDFDEPQGLDSVEPAARNGRSSSPVGHSRTTQHTPGSRRGSGTIRTRPPRLLRRDEQTPLSRVLQLAAAAIAAQLSGGATPTLPNVQPVGDDGPDNSLENFIQSLQQATSAQSQTEDGNEETGPRDGGLPNVNFLRVFRFSNPEGSQGDSTPGVDTPPTTDQVDEADRMDIDESEAQEGPRDRRLVTLVVVGVRSVPISNGPSDDHGHHTRPTLESLLRLPFIQPSNIFRNERGSGSLLRRADGRSRFSSHRHSTGSNAFPANYDSQRHQRTQESMSRGRPDFASPSDLSTSLPNSLSESPAGPHPPPSTPAEHGSSAVSSGTSSPGRRLSSASAALPQVDEDPDQSTEAPAGGSPFGHVHQRRRSDSEAARHRGLGSGSARRNGVVEPDGSSPSAGRSWLIYVVGTNLSENHPAFATPSLFTDNPTYEDMILLSSLLGPAKPPVASEEDVASAGGLFRLVEYGGSLTAEPLEGLATATETIRITDGERCLICLCDYEAADEVRLLSKCSHVYHRECIDQWLTTGRNSCPLCRGQGVSNSSGNDEQEATA